jgi:hypothetical protein
MPPPAQATAEPLARQPEADLPVRPTDLMLQLIVAFLAPLFVNGVTELSLARLAAIETLASYQARTQAELLAIANIIGFGLAAMATLRLAMRPDLSLSMTLRLHGCANALNRSAQQNVRLLTQLQCQTTEWEQYPPEPEPVEPPATTPQPPDLPAATKADRTETDQTKANQTETNLMWASAMNKVANELSLGHTAPNTRGSRRSDLMWSGTLASVAAHLAAGAGSITDAVKAARREASKRT